MLFEQQQQLQTPTINGDGGLPGCSIANPLLSSLDFLLLDDIELYLPSVHVKKSKNADLYSSTIECPTDNNNEHEFSNSSNDQHHEELFSDFDFSNLADFDEKSEFIDPVTVGDLELDKWISQSAFPSPPMEIGQSPLCSNSDILSNVEANRCSEDSTSSTIPWISEECTIQSSISDMIVPLSPPLSTASFSPAPTVMKKAGKRSGLSVTDRKLRKKDQNKTAAEKYRIKKKSQRHHVLDRRDILKSANRDLKLEADNLGCRIQQLKALLVDLLHVQLPSTIESS